MKFQLPRYSGTALFFATSIIGYIIGFFFIHKKISIDSWFWVHSTIAQSFAALVGFSALFIFHVLGRIEMKKENIINKCRVICMTSYDNGFGYYTSIPQYAIAHFGIDDFRLSLKKLKEFASKNSIEEESEKWKQLNYVIKNLQINIDDCERLQKIKEDLKSKYLEPFLLAIIVIIWAIAFLSREQISGEWLNRDNLGWLTAISLATVSTLGLIAGFLKSIFTWKI